METVFSINNNKFKQNLVFKAGLTNKILQGIQDVDTLQISNKLAKKGIPSDFKNNKIIAWCSDKSIEIFEQLNQRFNINLALPRGIYVEDFQKLNIENKRMYGLCNFFTSELKKNSNELISGETVFFNTFESEINKIPDEQKWRYNWNNINEITDYRHLNKKIPTNNFLYTILHEFSHVAHEDRILNKYGNEILLDKFQLAQNPQEIKKFQKKYGSSVSQICINALNGPLEAIACDIPRVIINSLDKETLMPIKNPFIGTPYENLSSLKRVFTCFNLNQENKFLRDFWNGDF